MNAGVIVVVVVVIAVGGSLLVLLRPLAEKQELVVLPYELPSPLPSACDQEC